MQEVGVHTKHLQGSQSKEELKMEAKDWERWKEIAY